MTRVSKLHIFPKTLVETSGGGGVRHFYCYNKNANKSSS